MSLNNLSPASKSYIAKTANSTTNQQNASSQMVLEALKNSVDKVEVKNKDKKKNKTTQKTNTNDDKKLKTLTFTATLALCASAASAVVAVMNGKKIAQLNTKLLENGAAIEKIGEVSQEGAKAIQKATEKIVQEGQNVVLNIGKAALASTDRIEQTVGTAIGKGGAFFTSAVKSGTKELTATAQKASEAIAQAAEKGSEAIAQATQKGSAAVTETVQKANAEIAETANKGTEAIADAIQQGCDGISQTKDKALEAINGAFENASQVSGKLDEAADEIAQMTGVMDGMLEGIEQGSKKATESLTQAAEQIEKSARSAYKKTPSYVVEKIENVAASMQATSRNMDTAAENTTRAAQRISESDTRITAQTTRLGGFVDAIEDAVAKKSAETIQTPVAEKVSVQAQEETIPVTRRARRLKLANAEKTTEVAAQKPVETVATAKPIYRLNEEGILTDASGKVVFGGVKIDLADGSFVTLRTDENGRLTNSVKKAKDGKVIYRKRYKIEPDFVNSKTGRRERRFSVLVKDEDGRASTLEIQKHFEKDGTIAPEWHASFFDLSTDESDTKIKIETKCAYRKKDGVVFYDYSAPVDQELGGRIVIKKDGQKAIEVPHKIERIMQKVDDVKVFNIGYDDNEIALLNAIAPRKTV